MTYGQWCCLLCPVEDMARARWFTAPWAAPHNDSSVPWVWQKILGVTSCFFGKIVASIPSTVYFSFLLNLSFWGVTGDKQGYNSNDSLKRTFKTTWGNFAQLYITLSGWMSWTLHMADTCFSDFGATLYWPGYFQTGGQLWRDWTPVMFNDVKNWHITQ